MREAVFISNTLTTDYYATINKRTDWDRILSEELRWAWRCRPYVAFLESLLKYDIFFISYNGFFLEKLPVRRLQGVLLGVAGK